MKKVSIIIPVYNAEHFIEETLLSALEQTWPAREIIVVDDGSTDESVKIIERYASQGVSLFKQHNKGACAARNLGLSAAEGDYIQFLDADDILHRDKIRLQMLLLEGCPIDVISSCPWAKFQVRLEEHHFVQQYINQDYKNPKQWLLDSWEGKGKGQTSIWLCSRTLLQSAGGWNEALQLNQDGEYFCRVLLKAKSIRFCKDAMVYYRTGNINSISKGKSYEKAKSLLISYQQYEIEFLTCDRSEEARHALMMNFLNFIYEYYPRYPDLIAFADDRIHQLGFNKYEKTGGRNFKRLMGIVGFYGALKLRELFGGK